jgi:hypothetical protein
VWVPFSDETTVRTDFDDSDEFAWQKHENDECEWRRPLGLACDGEEKIKVVHRGDSTVARRGWSLERMMTEKNAGLCLWVVPHRKMVGITWFFKAATTEMPPEYTASSHYIITKQNRVELLPEYSVGGFP